MLLVEDKTEVANSEERAICQQLSHDFQSFAWDSLRDHHKRSFSDNLWRKVSTDKMNCLVPEIANFTSAVHFLLLDGKLKMQMLWLQTMH